MSKRHFVAHFLSPDLSKDLGGWTQTQRHRFIERANSRICPATHLHPQPTFQPHRRKVLEVREGQPLGSAAFAERGYPLTWGRLGHFFLPLDCLEVMCFSSISIHKDRRCLQEEELAFHFLITILRLCNVVEKERERDSLPICVGAIGGLSPGHTHREGKEACASEEHDRKATNWGSVVIFCRTFQEIYNSLSMDMLEPPHQNHRK